MATFQLEGELRCRRQGVDTSERFAFAIQRSTREHEHIFDVKVTNWRVPAWSAAVNLREINNMLKALGIPSDLEQATQRMADALSHAEARLVMQDGSIYLQGVFEYGAKRDCVLRLPPRGSLETLNDAESHLLIDEVSGRVLGRLQAVGRELREVRQLLECERREHQAALASRDAMLTKLTEDVRSLKGRLVLFEGRAAAGSNHERGGAKRQRTAERPLDQLLPSLSSQLPDSGTQAPGGQAPQQATQGGGTAGTGGGSGSGVGWQPLLPSQPAASASVSFQAAAKASQGGAAPADSGASQQVSHAAPSVAGGLGGVGGGVVDNHPEVASQVQPQLTQGQPGQQQGAGEDDGAAAAVLSHLGPKVLSGAVARGRGGRAGGRGGRGAGPPRLGGGSGGGVK